MSDVPRYGTVDKPWPELPPAATLYSVHWSGLAVEFGDRDGPLKDYTSGSALELSHAD
ncbi:MAG TPA: hypothetical protein VHM22_18580 [Bradyrhizobium sp.]|nr:hypothetical protein [Bradyrhizobium sp.]